MYHSVDQRLTDELRWARHSTPRFVFIGRVRFKCDSNKFQDRARWCGHIYLWFYVTNHSRINANSCYQLPYSGKNPSQAVHNIVDSIMQESSVEAHQTKRQANLAEGDISASSAILTCYGEETVKRWWTVAERLTVDGEKWKLSYSVCPFDRLKKIINRKTIDE